MGLHKLQAPRGLSHTYIDKCQSFFIQKMGQSTSRIYFLLGIEWISCIYTDASGGMLQKFLTDGFHKALLQRDFAKHLNRGSFGKHLEASQRYCCTHIHTFQSFLLQICGVFCKVPRSFRGLSEAPLHRMLCEAPTFARNCMKSLDLKRNSYLLSYCLRG